MHRMWILYTMAAQDKRHSATKHCRLLQSFIFLPQNFSYSEIRVTSMVHKVANSRENKTVKEEQI